MGIYSRIFLVYGGARDPHILRDMPNYNAAHILQEDTNSPFDIQNICDSDRRYSFSFFIAL